MDSKKLVKKLQTGWFTLKQLKCRQSDIQALKAQGHMVNRRTKKRQRYYSIPVGNEMSSFFVSGKTRNPQTVRWLELSDIHAGSLQFDRKTLHQVLQRALDEGIKDVHIAGDLCDGYKVYRGHMTNLRYWQAQDQADELAEIFQQYPFRYLAIKGNHDYSFEKLGSVNPIKLIEDQVDDFHFLDSYAADIVIAGVVCRMVHLGGGRAYALSYGGQTYVRDLFAGQGEDVYVNGLKYRMRFLHCGHLHTYITFEAAGIWITHSGNFQLPNDYCIRKGLVSSQGGRLVEAVIADGKVLEYNPRFIKPRR